MNVLVIEDEAPVAALVRDCLVADGHRCDLAQTGRQGLTLYRMQRPDAVILDVGLPDISGFDLCRQIRQLGSPETPLLLLTARSEVTDRIVGWSSGADDYVTKPFSPKELPVRLRAVARRYQPGHCPSPDLPHLPVDTIQTAHLMLDINSREAVIEQVQDGECSLTLVQLSALEFDLLQMLASVPGRVWSRTELLDRVRGDSFVGDERVIDTGIKRLRRKIGPTAFIKTHHAQGYSFQDSCRLS